MRRDPPDVFRGGLSIKEIVRRAGRDRNTVRRALRSEEPPRYRRAERPSKLDPFREEIHRLLGEQRAGPLDRATSVAFSRRSAFVVTLAGKVMKIDGIGRRRW